MENNKKTDSRFSNDLIINLKKEFQKKSGNITLNDKLAQGNYSIIFEGKQNEKKFCVKAVRFQINLDNL
jgi:hypothetical protein